MTTPVFIPSGYLTLIPVQGPTIMLNFKNECPNFTHLKIIDYVKMVRSGNEDRSEVFSVNWLEAGVKKITRIFESTESNLFIIRAYFSEPPYERKMEMIIKHIDTAIALNLTVTPENGQPSYKEHSSFKMLSREEANNFASYF